MPGLNVVLRDTEGKEPDEVLRITQSGPPHVTVAYTGTEFTDDELVSLGSVALKYTLRKAIVLQGVKVNKTQRDRHDVLLSIDPELIQKLRDRLFCGIKNVIMRKPHVTVGTFATKVQAQAEAKRISKLLPRSVSIVGFFV